MTPDDAAWRPMTPPMTPDDAPACQAPVSPSAVQDRRLDVVFRSWRWSLWAGTLVAVKKELKAPCPCKMHLICLTSLWFEGKSRWKNTQTERFRCFWYMWTVEWTSALQNAPAYKRSGMLWGVWLTWSHSCIITLQNDAIIWVKQQHFCILFSESVFFSVVAI